MVHVSPGDPQIEPVVLLHGWGATSDLNWGRVLEPMNLARTTAYFDLRGHGEGPDPPVDDSAFPSVLRMQSG